MVEYLILDYNRPAEAKVLLESIKELSDFDYSITYLSNGGEQGYVKELKKQGLIDNLILNKTNVGCGAGTIQLFAQCQTEYAFYIQVDHAQNAPLTQTNIDQWIKRLQSAKAHCLGLSGDQARQGKYTERAQFINVSFYNSIPKSIGGPGPWADMKWTEWYMQQYFIENNKTMDFIAVSGTAYSQYNGIDPEKPASSTNSAPEPTVELFFRDSGKFTVRSNPDGSQWKQRTDTKQLWMLKAPTERFVWPNFTDKDWREVIETQTWEPGKVPFLQKQHSFKLGLEYWEGKADWRQASYDQWQKGEWEWVRQKPHAIDQPLNLKSGDVEGNSGQVPAQQQTLGLLGSGAGEDIMEIGFNNGDSARTFLSSSPTCRVVSFDICTHDYVDSAKEFIDNQFPSRHTLIEGDSLKSIPNYVKENPDTLFDLIFIDGGHDYDMAHGDLINCKKLAHKDTVVVMDDIVYSDERAYFSYLDGPTRTWEEAVQEGLVVELGHEEYSGLGRGMSWGRYNNII